MRLIKQIEVPVEPLIEDGYDHGPSGRVGGELFGHDADRLGSLHQMEHGAGAGYDADFHVFDVQGLEGREKLLVLEVLLRHE